MNNDLETAIALWDALDDEAEIFVPIVLNQGGGKNYFFMERGSLPTNKDNLTVRVFINKDEADSYKLQKRNNKLTLATTTVGHLLASLDRNLVNLIDNKIECVLSTLDMEGNFRTIETLWSNTNKNS